MTTSSDTPDAPRSDAPPASTPAPTPPAPVTVEHHNKGVLLAIAGTFLATLLGVGLAQVLAHVGRISNDRSAYADLVALMHTDCEASLDENRQLSPKTDTRPLRQSAWLQSAAFQNSLLLRFMDKSALKELMKAMSDAAWAEAAYLNALNRREMVRHTPVPPPPHSWPKEPDLGQPMQNYLEAQERVCAVLARSIK